jgi:hypothetical protein
VRAGAVVFYLGLGAAYSYLGWNQPYSWWVVSAFLLIHVVTGFLIGRWWAVLLPLVWALVSVGADGYDTPLHVIVLFQTPFFWAPALALGVLLRHAGREPMRRRFPLRSTRANSRMP